MIRVRWMVGLVCGVALAASGQTHGTWTSDGNGYWTDPARWAGGNIASGVNATGNFATVNITGLRDVLLTNQITIGHLLFGDATTPSHDWRLTNNIVDLGGGTYSTGALLLSVSAGVPTIGVVNRTLHLGARLDGTQGFRKYGVGNFVLWNTNATITGSVQIEGGLHQIFGEGAYGPTPGTFTPNAVVYSNLTVQNYDSYLVFSTNRGITLLPGGIGVWFRVGWGKAQTNYSAITGAGRLGITYDGAHMLLMSQSNDYTGGTWVGGGGSWWNDNSSVARLRLGNHEVIPHGAGRGDLVISNLANPVANKWTAWLEMNGYDETVNGLWGNGFISNNVAAPATLTVGAADANGVFFGTIDDGVNGAISVVKIGRGLQFLAGTNRFDGSVTVQNGLLGLGGVGQIGGDVNLHHGAMLSVGMTNLPQTLTVQGTMRATNATWILDLSSTTTPGSGVNDLLNLQGLEVVGANRIVVSPLAPLAAGTPYTVVQYWTLSGGGTVSADAPGTRYSVAVDTLTPGEVRLIVSGAASNLVWAGVNRRWNLTNSASWTAGSALERFYTIDSVTFDDSQRGGFVGIEEGVRVGAIVVDGSRSYTWVGYGGLEGAADLVKKNSGVLMLQNTNNGIGAVRVEEGTLVTIHDRTLGADNTRLYVTNNATWDLRGISNQFRVVTVSGAGVGGQGAIVNNGGGNMSALRFLEIADNVTLGGYNRWDVRNTAGTGFVSTLNSPFSVTKVGPSHVSFVSVWVDTNLADIVIKEGTFALEGSSAAGDPSRYLMVHSNATFQLWGTQPLNKQFIFSGGARLFTGSGSEAQNHLQNSVVLTNGIVLADVASGSTWSFSATVGGDGGLLTINPGIVRFNGAVNSTGPLIAQSGVLVLQSNAVVNGPSALVVRGTGRILVDYGRVNIADRIQDSTPIVLAGPGTFNLRGPTNATRSETVGNLVLLSGPATLLMENGTGTANLGLNFSGLALQQGSLVVQHTGAGTLGHLDGQSGSRVFVAGLADGFVPWATWYSTNFMWYSSARGLTSMVPPTVEFNGTVNQSGQHVKFTAGNSTYQLDDNRSVESLTITPTGVVQYLDVWGNTLTVAQGGVLQNGNTVFQISDSSGGGQITAGGGTLWFNVANAAATMRVSAVIGGAEFSKEGAGTMILLSQAATTNRTRIGGGILQLGNNSTGGMVGPGDVVNYGTLLFHRSDNLAFTNPIVGGGNVIKTNVNTITFTAPNTYTGFTVIGSGRVVVDRISDEADSNLGVARPERPVDSYLLIVDGELQVNGSGTSRTIRTVYVNQGGGMKVVTVGASDGVLRFDGQVLGSSSAWLKKDGPGTLVLGGSSADNVALRLLVAAGHVDLAKETFANFRALDFLALTNSTTARIIGNNGDQIYNTLWLWTNAVLDLNGQDETINILQGAEGRVINNAAGTTSIFTVGRINGTGHYGGTIDDGGGVVALHKTGTGELRLTNSASTYSGGTVLSNGALYVIADGALGAVPSSKQPDNIIAYGGKLQNQDSHTVLHANRGVMVLGTNLNLQAGWTQTLTVYGDISGPGSVTIAGDSGVVLLGGSNTFGGNLVQPSQTSRLRLLSSDAVPYGPGRGGLVTRTYLDLNGTSPRANWIEGSHWARIVNSNTALSTLTIGENDENTLYWSGLLNDAGGPLALRKVGSGVAALQAVGTNTMSGGVTVEGGVLALDSAPASGITVASNAEVRLVGRFGPVSVAAGGTISLGATITNSPVTITSGVVRLTAAGLQEGRLPGAFETNSANPATDVRLGTSYAHTREAQALFPDNSTYVYSGFLYVPGDRPVTWTFAKLFDDNVRFRLDGTNWIVHTVWNVLATTNVTLTPGYHEFELRLGQGGGGVGPAVSNFVWGFSVDRQGRGMLSADYYLPLVDMGDGLTFVVSTSSFGVANSFTTLGDTTFELASMAKPVVTGAVNVGGNVTFAGAPGKSADLLGPMTLNVSPTLTVTSGVQVTVKHDVIEGFVGAALTKAGAGILRLEGNALWTGNTVVANGTLQLAGATAPASPVLQIHAGATLDVTGLPGGTLTLGSGQTLKGNGTLAGGLIVDNGSTLSPGLSPGVLTVTGDLDFDSGGTFEVEVLGTLAGQWDQVLMQTGATLTPGGGTLSVIAPNPLTLGFVFPVISGWSAIDSSTFAGLPDGATFMAGVNQFQINYGTLPGYNDDVTLTVIPEPSVLGLLSMMAAAVLLRRRLR